MWSPLFIPLNCSVWLPPVLTVNEAVSSVNGVKLVKAHGTDHVAIDQRHDRLVSVVLSAVVSEAQVETENVAPGSKASQPFARQTAPPRSARKLPD